MRIRFPFRLEKPRKAKLRKAPEIDLSTVPYDPGDGVPMYSLDEAVRLIRKLQDKRSPEHDEALRALRAEYDFDEMYGEPLTSPGYAIDFVK